MQMWFGRQGPEQQHSKEKVVQRWRNNTKVVNRMIVWKSFFALVLINMIGSNVHH